MTDNKVALPGGAKPGGATWTDADGVTYFQGQVFGLYTVKDGKEQFICWTGKKVE